MCIIKDSYMKNIIRTIITFASGLAVAALISAPDRSAAAEYTIDSSHTFVIFEVGHLGIGRAHGMFRKATGSFDPEAGTLVVNIDAQSIYTANKKRDDHLKSPDFFNVKQFPTMTLKSKKITKNGDSYMVSGDLTIKDKTRTVAFEMKKVGEGKDPWGNDRIGFTGTMTINRLDFGVDYMPGGLSRDVKLTLSVEGIKKK